MFIRQVEESLNSSSMNHHRVKKTSRAYLQAIFLFLPFKIDCKPLKMVAHPCTAKLCNQGFLDNESR